MTTSRPSSTTSWPEPRRRGLFGGAAATARLVGLSLLRGRRGFWLALVSLLPLTWGVAALFTSGSGIKGGLGLVQLLSSVYFPRQAPFAPPSPAPAPVGGGGGGKPPPTP